MSLSNTRNDSDPGGISVPRRIAYAQGYLALGLVNDASDELEAIHGWARVSFEVLSARVDLYSAAKQWDMVEALARALTESDRAEESHWLALADACLKQGKLPEAFIALHCGEAASPKSARVQYEFARCETLRGNLKQARRRLAAALWLDRSLLKSFRSDPDFESVHSFLHLVRKFDRRI